MTPSRVLGTVACSGAAGRARTSSTGSLASSARRSPRTRPWALTRSRSTVPCRRRPIQRRSGAATAACRSRARAMARKSWAIQRFAAPGRSPHPPRRREPPCRPGAPSPVRARAPPRRADAGHVRGAVRPRRGSPPSLELPLASGQHPGDQAGSFGQRPVVREMTDEVPQILGRLGSRAEDLHPALEVGAGRPPPRSRR